MRDGQRFLVNAPAGGEAVAAPPFTVVTNWQAAFKSKVNGDQAREIFAVSLENGTWSDSPLCGR
jgi:hypothetical protein